MTELVRLGRLIGPRLAAIVVGGVSMADPSESGRAIFASGQWGYWSSSDSANGLSSAGVILSLSVTDVTSSRVFDVDGLRLQQDTSGGLNSEAHIRTNFSADLFRVDYQPLMVVRTGISSTADIRWFCGLATDLGPIQADNPAGTYYGVQYSSVRDTNFQFVIDNGATQTVVDSGIAADTSPHFVKVEANASDIIITLFDSTFTQQATNTFTTSLPAGTTSHHGFNGIRALAAVLKSIDQYYGTIVLRAP